MSTPVVLFVSLLLFMIIGVPVAWSLSLSCIAALLTMDGMPLVLLTQRVFTGANNFSFLAVPAFIIAGEVMSQGGISKRLVDMTSVLLGRVRDSLGIISVVASTIFAALSGSATATTAAIGGLMYPEMERRGYPKDFSAAVQAIGGTLGPVIPPSLMMIFYGVATGEPITKLLMSGVVPGILTCILLCLMVYIIAKKRDMPVEDEPFSWKRLWDATKDSILALLMPIIILVTIYFGICTATESAAIAAVYGIIIAKVVYRSVSWKGLWAIFKKSALQTVVVSIMVVTAQLFGWIVTYYNIPNLLATSIQSIASSATVFLFLVLVMLLIAGMFMEALSVVIIVAPILHPVALAYGIDPIFFGFFTVFIMCIGIATPPFGPCLFVSCSLSQRPFVKVSKEILPFIAVEILVAIILIFLPQIVTFLPNLVK